MAANRPEMKPCGKDRFFCYDYPVNLSPQLETFLSRSLSAYGLTPGQMEFLHEESIVLGEQRGTAAVARIDGQYFAVLLAPVLILPDLGPMPGIELIEITQSAELYPGSSLTMQDGALYLAGCYPLTNQDNESSPEAASLLVDMLRETHASLSAALTSRHPGSSQPLLLVNKHSNHKN